MNMQAWSLYFAAAGTRTPLCSCWWWASQKSSWAGISPSWDGPVSERRAKKDGWAISAARRSIGTEDLREVGPVNLGDNFIHSFIHSFIDPFIPRTHIYWACKCVRAPVMNKAKPCLSWIDSRVESRGYLQVLHRATAVPPDLEMK